MTDSIEAFIFARGGSKGVVGKNIRPLGGKPLIAHAIECAAECPSLGRVNISTDNNEIASVARAWGGHIPFMRPAELAGDTSSEWLAWRHAVKEFADKGDSFDIMVSLPTTSPFRSTEDVEACISMLRSDRNADAVITVCVADRSPYFNMVKLAPGGSAGLVLKPSRSVNRRQDAPKVYDITTVAYAVRTDFILNHDSLFDGRVRVVEVPAERALDIDTPHDFHLAELLFEARLNDQKAGDIHLGDC